MKLISEWTTQELEDKMEQTLKRFVEHRKKGDRLTEDEIDFDKKIKAEWKRRGKLGLIK